MVYLGFLVGMLLVAGLLAACGGNDSGVSHADVAQQDTKRVHWQKLNDRTFIVTVRMQGGRQLVCFEDAWGDNPAMSCDWVGFHLGGQNESN